MEKAVLYLFQEENVDHIGYHWVNDFEIIETQATSGAHFLFCPLKNAFRNLSTTKGLCSQTKSSQNIPKLQMKTHQPRVQKT